MATEISWDQFRELVAVAAQHDERNQSLLDAINDYHNHRTGDSDDKDSE